MKTASSRNKLQIWSLIVVGVALLVSGGIARGAGATSASLSIPLAISTTVMQDNPVAITRPVSVTLNDSGLISSGAFTASSGFTVSDQLLVFDNTVVGFDQAATTVYGGD